MTPVPVPTAEEIADGLAVDSRKATISCVGLARLIEKALKDYANSKLEEAARIADARVDKDFPNDDISTQCEIIARQIRNLKETP